MKIKMLTSMAGPGGVHPAGSTWNCEDEGQAEDLIEGGYAEEVEVLPEPKPAPKKGRGKKKDAGAETEGEG